MLSALVVGLAIGSAYSLLAVAVVLVYSGTKVLSLAVGEIGAFGLYAALWWHDNGLLGTKPPVWVAALVAMLIGGVLGLVVERLVMRPLLGRPALDSLVATLAVALFLALLELELYGLDPFPAPSPVGDGSVEIGGATLTVTEMTLLGVAALVALGLWLFLTRTSFGLATRATTSDPTVARLLGVPVNRVYVFSWGVAGLLSGAAAALLANVTGSLTPFSLTTALLSALAGAVIGGLDSLGGAVLGSLVVGVVSGVVGSRVDPTTSAGIVFLAVLLTLLVRPRGLFGSTRVAA
ncbi:MAG: branched-chain amino acid transporter permease [Frankiales bacterium]|nr:branched-chain amino acid transporter permease [Frankiales bacterium]MCW2708061.1 branched-chain amino acid transporter permease [Frankiales bacterium]